MPGHQEAAGGGADREQSFIQTQRDRSGKISLPPPADKEEGEGGGFSSSPPSDREISPSHKLKETGQSSELLSSPLLTGGGRGGSHSTQLNSTQLEFPA